jgi:FK506-binding nuclear protein
MAEFEDEDHSLDMDEDDEEVIDQFFWSLVVAPGKQYSQVLPFDLRINHVSLGEDAKEGSKSVLYCVTENGTSHPICTLRAGTFEQMSLNLFFPSDENLILKTSPGSAPVHLLGYCEQRINPDDEDDDESELGDEDLMADEEEEEEEEERVSSDSGPSKRKATPVNELPIKRVKKAEPAAAPAPTPAQPKKAAAQEAPAKAAPAVAAPAAAPPAAKKAEKKKTKDKEREKSASVPHLKEKADNGLGVQKKLALGVLSTLHQAGKGAKATAGKKVQVQYRGTLENGKQFDAGKINFRLGLGEVIKGWDIGVEGMQVGEKRTLICPSAAAYGKRGAPPDIPPNATLKFEVTLLNVQ